MLCVTWICPEVEGREPLGSLTELGQIAKLPGVDFRAVTGKVLTRQDIAAALDNICDVLIWSGHGEPGRLLMSGEGVIRIRWLALQARKAKPKLIVLAACGSGLKDNDLHSMVEGMSRVGLNSIGFPAATDDVQATAFTVELVRALSVGSTLQNAFDIALEEIGDSKLATGVFLMPGLQDTAPIISNRLDKIESAIEALGREVTKISEYLKLTNPTGTVIPGIDRTSYQPANNSPKGRLEGFRGQYTKNS